MGTKLAIDGTMKEGFVTLDGKVPTFFDPATAVSSELDFPTPIAGVITIDRTYYIVDFVIMSPGIRMVFTGDEGALVGLNAATAGLFFDVDAPAISGPMVLSQLTLDNPNIGASSELLEITSPGRTARVEYCSIRGNKAGTIKNCMGAVTLDSCFINGALAGFTIDGIVGALQLANMTSGNTPAGFISYDILATCTIIQAVTWRTCNFLTTDASDRGIRISDAAILPTGTLPTTILGALIGGCFKVGPGLTLEEGPGFLSVTDIELWSKGNGSLRDSNIHVLAYFFESVNFAEMIYTALDTWDVIVSDNSTTANTSSIIIDASTERFSLTKNSRQDWYVQYEGPQRNFELDVGWSIDLTADTSNNDLEFRITTQIGGMGAWVDIPSTHGVVQQVNRKQAISGGGRTTINPGDRFRIEVAPRSAPVNNTEYYRIQLIIG